MADPGRLTWAGRLPGSSGVGGEGPPAQVIDMLTTVTGGTFAGGKAPGQPRSKPQRSRSVRSVIRQHV